MQPLSQMTRSQLIQALRQVVEGSSVWWQLHAELDMRPVNDITKGEFK